MADSEDPHCPECGEPIGQTATYCMHCSDDSGDAAPTYDPLEDEGGDATVSTDAGRQLLTPTASWTTR
ncbi:hypothetical protein BRC84_05090 [Halobacteriales archaeon QS_1_68_44]|nr:MAG: hypothetical protein BRC84_05090 [Halobacteriales archaeon QS_1_68_44]